MTDQEILNAVRASGITTEQLTKMLAKNVILLEVQEKRAALARAVTEAEAAQRAMNEAAIAQLAPYQAKVNELRAQLTAIETQIAATL